MQWVYLLVAGLFEVIWAGIGIVGTFFMGIYALHEPITILQGLCVVMIVIGIAGLRLLGH